MDFKNWGKGLKESLQDAVDTVKEKAKEVELPDVKQAGMKASEQVIGLFKKADNDKIPSDNGIRTNPEVQEVKAVSARNAIKIIYFLMAADGEICHGEEEKFDMLGAELDPAFAESKEQIIKECRSSMEKAIDAEDYYDALKDGVEEALTSDVGEAEPQILPKVLVWDLLSVAYSDEKYDEIERKLLKYVVRKCNMDKAVFLEMESSMLTLVDLEKELEWIKTTDRPYLKIEAMVNELADRKNVVCESVYDLISL